MARLPRIVVPHCPHHVTQRGNRRQQTFFRDDDYLYYIEQLRIHCVRYSVSILAYCLMPNHIHLVVVPAKEKALRMAIGLTHQSHSKFINYRNNWQGYLWQGRFFSVPMDDEHTNTCIPYVEDNPVRAGLADHPWDYRWSSANARYTGHDDPLVAGEYLRSSPIDKKWCREDTETAKQIDLIKSYSRTGRPIGSDRFTASIERQTNIRLKLRKRI